MTGDAFDAEKSVRCRRVLKRLKKQLIREAKAHMLHIEKPYVVTGANAPMLEALTAAAEGYRKVLVLGSKGSGKTSCLKRVVDEANMKVADSALYCSAIEIYAAIFIRENETFLSKLAAAAVIAVDDIEALGQYSQGDRTIALLVGERDRKRRSTVLASSESFDELAKRFPLLRLAAFEKVSAHALSGAERRELAEALAEHYRTSESPRLEGEAVEWLAERFEGGRDLDTAVRFAMTAAGFDAGAPVAAADLAERIDGRRD